MTIETGNEIQAANFKQTPDGTENIGAKTLSTGLLSQLFTQRSSFTAGEAIDASTTPQTVYLKASDGKVYKTDSDADESTFKFLGIVGNSQNVALDGTALVQTSGVVAGFTGLTAGDRQYISATAGALTTTPVNNQSVEIAVAVSTTEVLIVPSTQGSRHFVGSDSVASGSGDVTNTQTIGFRPQTIIFLVTAADANEEERSWGFWSQGSTYSLQGGNGDASMGAMVLNTSVMSDRFTDGRMDITIENITDTGFDLAYDRDPSVSSEAEVRFVAIG